MKGKKEGERKEGRRKKEERKKGKGKKWKKGSFAHFRKVRADFVIFGKKLRTSYKGEKFSHEYGTIYGFRFGIVY